MIETLFKVITDDNCNFQLLGNKDLIGIIIRRKGKKHLKKVIKLIENSINKYDDYGYRYEDEE